MRQKKQLIIRIWHLMSVTVFLSSMAAFALVSYWSLQPFGKPVVEFPQGISIITKEVYQGDELIIYAPYCKNTPTQSTLVTRSFQDDLTYFLPSIEANIAVGCDDNYKSKIRVPENLPPDTYTYRVDFTYELNHIKSVTYRFETNTFVVKRRLSPATITEVCKITDCQNN
jgi:hypothetical protein